MIPRYVNMGDREAIGLVTCIVIQPGGCVELLSSSIATRVGAPDPLRLTVDGGFDADFTTAGQDYTFNTLNQLDTTNPFTVVWEAELDTFTSSYPAVFSNYRNVVNSAMTIAYSNAADYKDVLVGHKSPNSKMRFEMHSGLVPTAQRHWGVFSHTGGTISSSASYMWINGIALTPFASGDYGNFPDETGIGHESTNNRFDGAIRQVRVYNYAWDADLALRFYDPSTRDSLYKHERRTRSFGITTAGGFQSAWARNSNSILGAGMGL